MYLTSASVLSAIQVLRAEVHPFIGITFLACKSYGLRVGATDDVSIDTLTREHMDKYHRIDRRSSHYFQPFRGGANWWVNERYPSTGLQTVNTQTFGSAFIHPRASRKWGFEEDYLDRMKLILEQRNFSVDIPADAMAVWLLKDRELGTISSCEELVDLFFSEFEIAPEERTLLFSKRALKDLFAEGHAVSADPLEMTSVLRELPDPPDAEAESGRTIVSLCLSNAGPAPELSLDFGERLTMITGDNGLGKSFVLDFAWWAATGSWADRQALPRHDQTGITPTVGYTLRGGTTGKLNTFEAKFNQRNFSWERPRGSMTIEALAIFSRADGSFAIADPIRSRFNHSGPSSGSLTAYEVWNGRPGLIEGLIRDWIRWQSASDKKTFDLFSSVLKRLSPEDLGTLTPGAPIRLPGDPREIPTIQHRYGTVPVSHASSGVQRILLLAYLVIWSWREHELASAGVDQPPLRRMMLIVDELEAHLHPKWQRIVLPALMGIGDLLSSDLALQVVAATHSPMILASMEASFDPASDLLYHLYASGPTIRLEETPFVKYGDASGWLTSPLFGLRHARSREAELAIEAAKSLQLQDAPTMAEVEAVSSRLKTHLAGDDKFWPRWIYFAEQHGVNI